MTSISLSTPIQPPVAESQASHAAPSARVEEKAQAEAPAYFSPVVRIDPATAMAIWQVRNSETGAVERQFPADVTVKAYRSHMDAQPQLHAQDGTLPAPAATVDLHKEVPVAEASTGPDLKTPGAPLPKEAPTAPITA